MKSDQNNSDFEKDLRFVLKNRDAYKFADKLNEIHQAKSRHKRNFFQHDFFKYGIAALLIIALGLSVFVLIRQSRKPLSEKVFEQYYAAYQYLNYRGDDGASATLLMKGADLVNEENYEAALVVASKILSKNPENIEAHFLSGVSLLGVENFQAALEHFDKVARSGEGYFHEYAEWYKALLLIKENRMDEAVFLLDVIQFEKGPFSKKAEEILKTLHSKE